MHTNLTRAVYRRHSRGIPRALIALLAFAVFLGLAAPAQAADAPPPTTTVPVQQAPPPISEEEAAFNRQLVQDIAEFSSEVEERDAALAALATNDPVKIKEFLDVGVAEARKAAAERKKRVAEANRAQVAEWARTAGPTARARAAELLATSDDARIADFVAFGKRLADDEDRQATDDAVKRAKEIEARVVSMVALGGPEVKAVGQAALDTHDPVVIAEFFTHGYAVANQRDADARAAIEAAMAARNKALAELKDLADRSARAANARTEILNASVQAVRFLTDTSNAMGLANQAAKKAGKIFEEDRPGRASGHRGRAPELAQQTRDAKREWDNAAAAAHEATTAAAMSETATRQLAETGLTHGIDWGKTTKSVAAAAQSAAKAAETAFHAAEATEAASKALDADANAQVHADNAARWRQAAEDHAKSAATLAEAARQQAKAAADAATRTKEARTEAERAEQQAWAAAKRTHDARLVAEQEARNAAAARARAEQEARNAAGARAKAQANAAIAADARVNATRLGQAAETAEGVAKGEDDKAADAVRRAVAAEQARDAKAAWAASAEAYAAGVAAGEAGDTARAAATGARNEANTATTAAGQARAAANDATGAAVRARAAAIEAAGAAARANAAANKAEAEAAATHAFAVKANAAAATATAEEALAAEHARSAQQLAASAASEAAQALVAADRTKAESDAALTEAVAAAVQAGIAVRAAQAAGSSAAGIADPTGIAPGTPATGTDVAAELAQQVAEQAKIIGVDQAKAAQDRATVATAAAARAADAAKRASNEVAPAYTAAAAAAESASVASRSAADAQRSAAAAADDAAAARNAGARASQADAQAQGDAKGARRAANAANADAAIAGRSATSAETDAAIARGAASKAESDAAIARGWADRAEAAATKAEEHARNAKAHAEEALKTALRTDEQARKQDLDDDADDARGDLTDHGDGLVTWVDPETGIVYLNGVGLSEDAPGLDKLIPILLKIAREEEGRIFPKDHPYRDPRYSVYLLLIKACIDNSELCGKSFQLKVAGMGTGGADPAGNNNPMGFLVAGLLAESLAGQGGRWSVKPGTKPGVKPRPTAPCNCFPAGTTVSTDHGQKPIEQIAVGDQVWARDLKSGHSQLRSVVGLFNKHADQILTVTTGKTTLQVTPQHPFWVIGRGWINAGDLKLGDRLSTLTGAEQPILTIASRTTSTIVYNFEVAGDHNYYITDAQLLVHNCNLTYHEQAGGHAIARHVGRTDAQLAARNIPRSSTFNDLATAEAATHANITTNKGAIDAWLKNPNETQLFVRNAATSDMGRIYVKATEKTESPTTVVTVVRKNQQLPGGYWIHTSYLN